MSEKAGRRIRTDDLLITNQLLYQLSYAGIYEGKLAASFNFAQPLYPQFVPLGLKGTNRSFIAGPLSAFSL